MKCHNKHIQTWRSQLFPIRLLVDNCCWTFPLESLSSFFEEAKASKVYGTNLLGLLQFNKLSISELSLPVSLSVTLDFLENYRYILHFCVLTLILLKNNLFFECCDVIEFSWSRLPYFTWPMKILMAISRFAD